MNAIANGNSNKGARFRALALPVIAALVLLDPASNWARSQSTAKSAPSAKTAPAPAAKGAAAAKPHSKGLNTGITVHGWWVIDVRNPDGKLVAHREFENTLTTGTQGGDWFLAGVLGRTMTVGPWWVGLGAANAGPNNDGLAIVEPAVGCSNIAYACAPSLSILPTSSTSNGFTFYTLALTGTVVVPTGSALLPIGSVQTFNDDNNVPSTEAAEFTQANLATALPVSPGQLVTIAVTFSFK